MKRYGLMIGAFLSGIATGLVPVVFALRKNICKSRNINEELFKSREFYFILLQWIKVHQEGRNLEDFFIKNGYKSVAIYGMKELGEALLDELRDSQIEVKYGIDRDAYAIYTDIDVFKPDDCPDEADVVVVTAVHYYDEIKKMLQGRLDCEIISIEEVVWKA